jgi:hypothetical protein
VGTKCGDAPFYIIDNTFADIAEIGASIFALFGDDEAQRETETEYQRRVRRSPIPASEPRRFVEILAKYRGDYGNLRISYRPACLKHGQKRFVKRYRGWAIATVEIDATRPASVCFAVRR